MRSLLHNAPPYFSLYYLQYGCLDFRDLVVDDAIERHLGRKEAGPDSLRVENGLADLGMKRFLVRGETSQLEHEFLVEDAVDSSTAWWAGERRKRESERERK